MQQRAWLKYVHWFGYFASLVVVIEFIAIGYVATAEWMGRSARSDHTRMHDGPLLDRLKSDQDNEVANLLEKTPPFSDRYQDGLRMVSMPSFGDTYFSISLRRVQAGAEGQIIFTPVRSGLGSSGSFKFKMASSAYARLVAELDVLSAEWTSEASFWTDGTRVAYERAKNGHLTSGLGNSPNFYGKINAAVFNAIRPSVAQLSRFENDGHPMGTFD
ncbi:hypothetical protein [Sphingobium sp. CR28]|uniref:hypothetical protein n=1 Tax=Sphingobium sp. CR28 TaxID=3400272 RepID=UPI003FEFCC8A